MDTALPEDGSTWIWRGGEVITVIQCVVTVAGEWWVQIEGDESNRTWYEVEEFMRHAVRS